MKKIIGIVLALFLTINCFAKEIEMQIVETEFGIEISNLDGKGKKICKGYLNTEYDNRVFIIFKKSSDTFNIEELVNDFVYNNYLSDYLIIDNGIFKSATIKDSKVPKYGPLVDYDSLLIIPKSGKFSIYRAICDGKNLNLWISGYIKDAPNRFNQKVQETIKEKEKKEAEREAEREREAAEYKIAIEKERVERERIGKLKDKNERKKIFEQNGSEGYDYFVWGTTIEDFLIVYPKAKKDMENSEAESEYTLYRFDEDYSTYRLYFFFKNQLYMGKTVYQNPDNDKLELIINKLKTTYGSTKDTDEKRYYDDSIEANVFEENDTWISTETFEVQTNYVFRTRKRWSDITYSYVTDKYSYIVLINNNPKLRAECIKFKEDLENEKKKKALDNFEL